MVQSSVFKEGIIGCYSNSKPICEAINDFMDPRFLYLVKRLEGPPPSGLYRTTSWTAARDASGGPIRINEHATVGTTHA